MKAFIRSTSWTRTNPDVIRVELEVIAPENGDGIGIKVLAGNQVHIYGESHWERFVNRLKRGQR